VFHDALKVLVVVINSYSHQGQVTYGKTVLLLSTLVRNSESGIDSNNVRMYIPTCCVTLRNVDQALELLWFLAIVQRLQALES